MKISLARLRILKVQADSILSQKALGFIADTKVSKLGRLAQQRIDYEDAFDKLGAEKGEIVKKVYESNQRLPEEKITELVLADKEFLELTKQEEEVWQKEVDDFNFIPIELLLKEDVSAKFKDETLTVQYRGRNHQVNPYLSLHQWIDEGFIELKEE